MRVGCDELLDIEFAQFAGGRLQFCVYYVRDELADLRFGAGIALREKWRTELNSDYGDDTCTAHENLPDGRIYYTE